MLVTSFVGAPVILSGHSTSLVRTRRIRAQSILQTTQRIMTAASSTASAAAVRKSTYARGVDIFTHTDQVDTALLAVSARAEAWAQVGLDEKIDMLKAIKCRMIKCSMQIGAANAVVTGFGSPGSPASSTTKARSCTYGLLITDTLTCHVGALMRIVEQRRDGTAPAAADLPHRRTADGRSVLQVTGRDRPAGSLFLRGSEGFVYLKPGHEPSQGQEEAEARRVAAGGACFVLGAGNQAFLGIVDTLYAMFRDDHTVCLKYHDTQAETAPFMNYFLEPLTQPGYLKTFHCDLEMTRHALQHSAVCRVHVTGANRTHDAIGWGTGEEAAERKAANQPVLQAPMTSELGNITPVVIVPGAWAPKDLRTAAQLVAFNMADNAGCNCLSPKVVVLAEDWPQAAEFEAVLKEEIAALPAAPAWYPGVRQLHEQFVEKHPGCELIQAAAPAPDGELATPPLPWAVHSVTLDSAADAAAIPGLASEFFAPILTIARLSSAALPAAPAASATSDGALAAAFLRAVPGFLEEGVWGNLVATVYAPPDVEAAAAAELQECLDSLRYGSVLLNTLTYFAYQHVEGVWGGFQAADTSLRKPGSGVGHVLNVYGVDGVEKQVVRAKWGMSAPPATVPLPRFAVKAVTGAMCGGVTGLWQAATP